MGKVSEERRRQLRWLCTSKISPAHGNPTYESVVLDLLDDLDEALAEVERLRKDRDEWRTKAMRYWHLLDNDTQIEFLREGK